MRIRLASSVLLAAALFALAPACGPSDGVTDVPADAGTRSDAGVLTDGGNGVDAGSTPDAGAPRDLVVTAKVPTAPRRGPIELRFQFADPNSDVGTGHLVQIQEADQSWRPATVTTLEETGTSATYLWDSFADTDQDRKVPMRIVVRDPDGDVTLPFDMEVRNAPDTDRIVVVAHALKDLSSGGATDLGTEVSVLLWNGLEPGFIGQPRRIDVGQGPRRVRAAPHGRATAVLNDRSGTVTILTTELLADVATVKPFFTLTLPAGQATDVRWSRDGRFLFVLGSKGETSNAPAIWRYTPAEDLSNFDDVAPVTLLPGPPSRFDVAPSGDFIVSCGSGGTGLGKVLRYDRDGKELGRVEADYGPPQGLSVTPDGQFALFTSFLFGDEVRQFSLAGPALELVGTPLTTVRAPEELVFHPGSSFGRTIGLVSSPDRNYVTPFIVTATGIELKPVVSGMTFATSMDVIERGTQAGTVLVSLLSGVGRVELTAQAGATPHATAWDFGAGTTNMTYGLAIQR